MKITKWQLFNYNILTDLKLSIAQNSKIIQSGRFLGRLLGPLLKTGLPLIKNVIKLLAKSILIPLGLTAATSAADAGIHKKVLGSWNNNCDNFKWGNEWHNGKYSSIIKKT